MNKDTTKRRQPQIVSAVLLFVVLGMAFFVASRQIGRLATESCYHNLHQSTQQFCRELRKNREGTRKILTMAAGQLAAYDAMDSPETRRFLAAFQEGQLLSRLALLLPGDRVLLSDGSLVDAAGVLSFQREAALGIHISGRESELDDPNQFLLRHYVPVVQNGRTVAMLYGVMDLAKFRQYYTAEPLAQGLQIYIMEGKSGDFLLDTVHDTLGNIVDFQNRQPKPGHAVEYVANDLATGKSGRTAFRSNTFGAYYYCDYAPVGINDWVAMVTISERTALADAYQIRATLYLLAGCEAAALIVYFLWLLSQAKRDASEKEHQLQRIQYMLDVEGTLFGAARNPALMTAALHKVADTLQAKGCFFLLRKPLEETQAFYYHPAWSAEDFGELTDCFLALSQRLKQFGGIISYDLAALLQEEPTVYALSQRLGIGSLMLLPVSDSQGEIIGALGAVELAKRWKDTAALESVLLSFWTAANQMESFRMVQEMGLMDHLTGLRNRNSFQQAMEELEQTADETLACVYVDVDGLHALNNQCGHMLGDRMLQLVAKALQASFGAEHTYRIGGDEFLAFAQGLRREEVQQKIRETERTVTGQGYHISIGTAWRQDYPLVYELVRQAEAEMYAAKRSYYQDKDGADLARDRNQQLEALLTEKQDLDAFRSVLASQYKGVYVVNLGLDAMRPIYIPPYFATLLEEARGKYSQAMRRYVKETVLPEYQAPLLAFADFTQLKTWLDQGVTPALRYQKRDGTSILLEIYPCPQYSPQEKECIWIFDDLDAKRNKIAMDVHMRPRSSPDL